MIHRSLLEVLHDKLGTICLLLQGSTTSLGVGIWVLLSFRELNTIVYCFYERGRDAFYDLKLSLSGVFRLLGKLNLDGPPVDSVIRTGKLYYWSFLSCSSVWVPLSYLGNISMHPCCPRFASSEIAHLGPVVMNLPLLLLAIFFFPALHLVDHIRSYDLLFIW